MRPLAPEGREEDAWYFVGLSLNMEVIEPREWEDGSLNRVSKDGETFGAFNILLAGICINVSNCINSLLCLYLTSISALIGI